MLYVEYKYRSSHPKEFCNKGVLKKFTVKNLCQSIFFKRETLAPLFSCDFCEIFKNTFSYRTPLVAESVNAALNCLLHEMQLRKLLEIWEEGLLIVFNYSYLLILP